MGVLDSAAAAVFDWVDAVVLPLGVADATATMALEAADGGGGRACGEWTLAFALELMLFRRPYFAVANVLAIGLLIVLVRVMRSTRR